MLNKPVTIIKVTYHPICFAVRDKDYLGLPPGTVTRWIFVYRKQDVARRLGRAWMRHATAIIYDGSKKGGKRMAAKQQRGFWK